MKMPKKVVSFVIMFLSLSLVGCANVYSPPTNLNPATSASIQGSKLERSGLFSGSLRAEIKKIDGLPAKDELFIPTSWDDSYILAPGSHTISVQCVTGMFITGIAKMKADFMPGQDYVARSEPADDGDVLVWIESVKGQPITPKTYAARQIYRETYVPIFIPTK